MPCDAEDSPSGVVAQSESDEELAAMLAWAAANIRLEWNPPPSPEHLQPDDSYLGSEQDSQPRLAPVPFFSEVHEELMKSWRAPFTDRPCFPSSFTLTSLNSGMVRGYPDVPQMEHAILVH